MPWATNLTLLGPADAAPPLLRSSVRTGALAAGLFPDFKNLPAGNAREFRFFDSRPDVLDFVDSFFAFC